jgi:hypothetical protein
MNPESLALLFREKNLRREQLANLPFIERMRLVEALRDTGLYLRRMRRQVSAPGVESSPATPLERIAEPNVMENSTPLSNAMEDE